MAELYTKHFSNCKAVFQGGGCKGVAYLGAYKRAYERGVFFSELAGTSAGSIVAALIAAGAKPEQLNSIILSTDFSRFIKKAQSTCLIKRLFERFVLFVFLPRKLKKYSSRLSISGLKKAHGFFDSKEIELFVDDALMQITGKKNLTFEDLIPDLHVVSADIKTRKVKVWNKTNTPKACVSKAVRASCSIPLFFTPVDNRYVDGGMLSNLPYFLFSKDPHYNKILCFRNEGDEDVMDGNVDEADLMDHLFSLVGTIVDGADSIQQQYGNGTHEVIIHTGSIKATDFQKLMEKNTLDELIKSGEKSMDDFLDSEDIQDHFSIKEARTVFHTEEQMHSMVAELSVEDYETIYVIRDNAYWSWILFLSVVKWINSGAVVRIVIKQEITHSGFEKEELARRRMLKAMGCELLEQDMIPVKGFFFSKKGIWTGIIYDKGEGGFEGRFYASMLDQQLIRSVISRYQFNQVNAKNQPITISECPEEELLSQLRKVPEYRDAKLQFDTINLKDLIFMNPMIRALKYRQIQLMFDLYKGKDISKFSSASLRFPNGKDSIIGPPVVECHNGMYYLIEGNTRCLFAFRHGIKSLRVVIAEDVKTPLPCSEEEKYGIDEVLLSDKKLEAEKRYSGFERQYFRHIEANIRPVDTYMI